MITFNLKTLANVTVVTEFANARLQLEGIVSLFNDMQKMWSGLHDQQGTHFIVGVNLAHTKTDACKGYASELIVRYFNAHGMTLQNWSPESLRTQSRDREGGLAAIGVQNYQKHEDLFKWVMSFVIGIDPLLVDAAFALKNENYRLGSIYLVYWILNRHKFIVTSTEYDELRKPDLKQVEYNYPALVHNTELLRRENINVMFERLIDAAKDERYGDLEKDDFLDAVLASTVLEPTFEQAYSQNPINAKTVVIAADDPDPVKAVAEARAEFLKS